MKGDSVTPTKWPSTMKYRTSMLNVFLKSIKDFLGSLGYCDSLSKYLKIVDMEAVTKMTK